LIGATEIDYQGVTEYLSDTGQVEFLRDMSIAEEDGMSSGMILVSLYAKLCYRSLVLGKNSNIGKTREIADNITATIRSGHGSVFEHCNLNFLTTDCSRVFTHELVRHRVGTAFSQTSGRYCTVEDAELVLPPELEEKIIPGYMADRSIGDAMRDLLSMIKQNVRHYRTLLKLDDPGTDFATKKRLTSALRRIMPNGATNEIGWTVNVRSLRHMLELRTSRYAEWEIRQVFHDVGEIIRAKFPMMLHGGERIEVDGLNEWTKLRI
jgi:thymidylate synthase (FAD)